MNRPGERNPNPARGRGFRVGAALLLALGAAVVVGAADDDERCSDPAYRDAYACHQVIVRFAPGFDPATLSAVEPGVAVSLIPQLGQAWVVAPRESDVDTLLVRFAALAGVRSVERNGEYRAPECRQINAPILDLSATRSALAVQPALVAMDAVPEPGFGRGVVVAVLDTGIDRAHPALADATVLPGIDLVAPGAGDATDAGDGVDGDGNGVVDDGYGHGTAVAGLIHVLAPAAVLLPVRVLDDECHGTAFAFAAGVVGAVDAGARIINASLGAREPSHALRDAMDYAAAHGALVIAAAGNTVADDGDGEREQEIQFPASHRSALGVAAVSSLYVAAPTTACGRAVKLSAPGVDVLVPWRGRYGLLSGTSASSALVSGAAAVGLGRLPALDRVRLVELLRTTAIPVDAWNPDRAGLLGAGVPEVAALGGRTPRIIVPPRPTDRRRPEGESGR